MQLKEDALGTEKLSGIPDASSDALTGVGVAFPIVTFISAFSAFVGSGGAPLSAIWQGKGDHDRAEKILGNGVTLLIFFSAALMIVFSVFAEPLLYLFGASDATVGYGKTYILIYLTGTLFVELALGLNPYIIAQGAAKTGPAGRLVKRGVAPRLLQGRHLGRIPRH